MTRVLARLLLAAWLLLPAAGPIRAAAVPAAAGICDGRAQGEMVAAIPEEVGLSSGVLARVLADLHKSRRDLHGLVVARGCGVVVEVYAKGTGREHNHAVYSITKTVVVTLVGHLLHTSRLPGIDLPVANLMARPETVSILDWRKLEWISLAHVLSMTSGLDYRPDPPGNPAGSKPLDRLARAIEPPVAHEPGRMHRYHNGDAAIAGAVAAAVAGRELHGFAEEALFRPLGFENFDWWFVDDAGRVPGGFGLRLRLVDMLKLGQLWLEGGVWNGHRIFDAEFHDRAWRAGVNDRYGLYWWRNREQEPRLGTVYAAVGSGGQRILVVPDHGIVAAWTANLIGREEKEVDDLMLNGLADALLPAAAPSTGIVSEFDPRSQGQQALADQLALPFEGKPARPPREQDVPRATGKQREAPASAERELR